VTYDGTRADTDLQFSADGEIWPLLYHRAYRQIAGPDFQTIATAVRRLTGQPIEATSLAGNDRTNALFLKGTLALGRMVIAATGPDGPRYVGGDYGLIVNHAYTVMGVDLPATGSAVYVTL